jgi:quercetin dioxygenase-like cupin family protein
MSTMNAMSNTVTPTNAVSLPGEGRGQAVMGVTCIYKLEEQQAGGSLVCLEITVPPGEGIPSHMHRDEDESIYVITGRIALDGDDLPAPAVNLDAGSFFHGPRGRWHGFHCVGTEAAKILVFITPGASSQAMFCRLAELTRLHGPKIDPAMVAEVARDHGITVALPA